MAVFGVEARAVYQIEATADDVTGRKGWTVRLARA
jgi:hypothetical protein